MKLKELMELRTAKQQEMKDIIERANTEKRALNEEEQEKFNGIEQQIRDIDATIKAINIQRDLDKNMQTEDDDPEERSVEERELDAFDAFLRGKLEERGTEVNMTQGENGAVVPTTIANKIIEKVVDMCPIYHDADRYNVTGNLQIPYYDEDTGDIEMEYADEFTEGESKAGKFGSISLTGFLGRAICDVSKSLINNSSFNLVDFVINRMAKKIARFIEKELLHGTDKKIEGLSTIKEQMTVTTASETAITSDELIDLQESVPDVYQGNAYWIMNKETRKAIRKLKDGQGNYLLNKDANSRWGYTLFGKDVYTTDSMDKIGAGTTVIFYGDYMGLAVKVSEDININVLRETKARQHAIEVLGFVELDAKIQNGQMIAKMNMKTA